MIHPKFKFHSKSDFVFNDRLFVDREEARALFATCLDNCSKRDYTILNYYGVGGVGKSKLLSQIKSLFIDRIPKGIIFHVDLQDANNRSVGETLMRFADNCSRSDIDFVAYNLAYAVYFSRKHCGEEYGRGNKSFSKQFDSIFDIIGIWDGGCVGAAVDVIERVVAFAKKRTLDQYILDDLKLFETLSLAEIESRLPAYFQYDVCRYTLKHPDAYYLFTIDTFEALNVNQSEEIHRRHNEEWIQEIISNFSNLVLPNCIFVICGREPLRWGEEWIAYIQSYHLKDFNQLWAMEYLNQLNILDKAIVDTIIKSSQGHPFYLYISAKTYYDICNKGIVPKASDFKGSFQDIISRFIYNLTSEEVRILKYLSIPNYFTQDIFSYILKEYGISCDPLLFDHITSYSFIRKENREYYIHSLMRDGLNNSINSQLQTQLNVMMLNYHEIYYAQRQDYKSLIELVYHASRAFDIKTFNNWLQNKGILSTLLDLQTKGEQNLIFIITENLINYYGITSVGFEIINMYIDALHLGGDYQAAVRTCEDYLSQFSDDEIYASELLLRMQIRKIHHSMFYVPVNKLLKDAENIISDKRIRNYKNQYYELLFLLGGNLGVLSGDFNYAKKWLDQSMLELRSSDKLNYILRVVRKLADIYCYNNDANKAIDLLNTYITINSAIENRYQVYIMGTLGEVYRKLNKTAQSEICFNIVKEKSIQKNLVGWICHSELALALIKFEQNEYEGLLPIINSIEDRYKKLNHRWGVINTRTLKFMLISKTQSIEPIIEDIVQLKEEASSLSYKYNVAILDELLLTNNIKYFHLFFL